MTNRSPSAKRTTVGGRAKQRYKRFKPHSNPHETPAWRNKQPNEAARRLKRMSH